MLVSRAFFIISQYTLAGHLYHKIGQEAKFNQAEIPELRKPPSGYNFVLKFVDAECAQSCWLQGHLCRKLWQTFVRYIITPFHIQ